MERNPEEELFERLAVAIGEPLEQVWRMSDVERRQLIEVLGLGHVARPVLEEKVGQGGHENTVVDDTRGVGQGGGHKEQKCGNQVELEEASAKTKDEEEPVNDVIKGSWVSSVEKQLKEDAAKVARLLVGTRNEVMGEEQLEAYLQAHMNNPNRVKVVLEELTGVDAQAEEDTHLLDIDAEADEQSYQGKGKGQGKGKSNILKRGLADIDQGAEGEHRGEGVVESREIKQRKLDENCPDNPAAVVNSVEVEHEKGGGGKKERISLIIHREEGDAWAHGPASRPNIPQPAVDQQANASPILIDEVKGVEVGDPKEVVGEERLLVDVVDAQKDPDTVNPGAGPSGISKHSGESVQQKTLKLKDIRQLVGDPGENLAEQEHEAVAGKAVEAVGESGGGEAVNPTVNMQAENVQLPVILDESVVILDPMLNNDGEGEEEEQVLQLLRKQLAPGRDRVYSPEVRRLAEILAEMFPNTPLTYLLHRCTFQW